MEAMCGKAGPVEPTVILIEDDVAIAELIAYILEDRGMVVHCADNASRGLALANEFRPDLIVTDLHMPGLNGIDVLMATRREERLRGTPVMIITGDLRPEMRHDCMALGARTYLTKPFDGDQLLRYVWDTLSSTEGDAAPRAG